ncbi:HAD family hydrolase [Catellatospora sp. NPDC049609]|uniref:HAD family hydrolase n=1 Tax=Catellatospora sp. NPDC049609 TaxID=3155505 RepID=UPI003435C683
MLLDFYGTVVAEDDAILADIYRQVLDQCTDPHEVTTTQVGSYRWRVFREEMAADRAAFRCQRDIAVSSLARTVRRFGSAADPAALCASQFAFWREPDLFPDARAFLDLVDVPVCVVSNIDRADVLAAIAHHGLPLAHVVTSEDVGSYKPHPAMFQAALDLLGLPAGAVLHIGDSLSADITGAHHLGIPSVWVNRSGKPRPDPLHAITEVDTLFAALPLVPHRQ